eukprot:9014135-Alexandrium_andersonii.AAC.1
MRIYGDVLQVPEHCGAEEQRCLLLRQLSGTGVRTWCCDPVVLDTPFRTHIRIYIFVTDQGGDQKGAHSLLEPEVANVPGAWMLRQWCLQHVVHLMVVTSMI